MSELTKAYQMVYDDLKKISLFMGKVDVKNGNAHFANGLCTIMETIAFNACRLEEFNEEYERNFQESVKKVR